MKSFAIIARDDETSRQLAEEVKTRLLTAGCTYNEEKPDTVFTIGGDGTFLRAVHAYLDRINEVTFTGINTGSLGFYTNAKIENTEEVCQAFLSNTLLPFHHRLLVGKSKEHTCYAVNEIRIENAWRTQLLDVQINDEPFETIHATGICVCSAFGSTAYNRSLGGPIVEPGLPVLVLNQIGGIHNRSFASLQGSLVLSDKCKLQFHAQKADGAVLGADQDVFPLTGEVCLEVSLCPDKIVTILQLGNKTYFEKLRSVY